MALLNKLSVIPLLFLLTGCAANAWEWNPITAAPTAAPPPDELMQPYQLPTFSGDEVSFHTVPALPPPAPRMDFDAVFSTIVACYPVPSNFNIDVKAQIVAQSAEIWNADDTTQGRYYARVVASMPLYSTAEIDRATQFEANIRDKIAQDVGGFFEALSRVTQAHRELGLFSSLESRSQARVKQGVAQTDEQIKYLERTIKAHQTVTTWNTQVNEMRIRLASYCREGRRNAVSAYLGKVHNTALNQTPQTIQLTPASATQ